MIITRTPYRISFAGGGSDLAAFFRDEPGCVVSATIDKYITIAVTRKYDGLVRVSYSRTENVSAAKDVEHPLARACLQMANITRNVEVVSIGDLPHGAGLGSSSAFTVGLLHALYALQGEFHTAGALASDACHAEIELAHSPVGKQDQYAAAFGGLRCYTFYPDGSVSSEALSVDAREFAAHLLLCDTGLRRDAGPILESQQRTMRRADIRALANLANGFRASLLAAQLHECGAILDSAWWLKRKLSGAITSDVIDDWYDAALTAGAWGGKLCGAGGGGFLLFLAPPERHGAIVRALGLRRVAFNLVNHGSQVVYAD